MLIGEIHAIGVLDAGNDLGAVLDLEVGLHDLDVVELALAWIGKVGASLVESQVPVVGLDELVNGGQHGNHDARDSSCAGAITELGECLKAE